MARIILVVINITTLPACNSTLHAYEYVNENAEDDHLQGSGLAGDFIGMGKVNVTSDVNGKGDGNRMGDA